MKNINDKGHKNKEEKRNIEGQKGIVRRKKKGSGGGGEREEE
jgi:hypothetical protein